jgi:hypothetical protein
MTATIALIVNVLTSLLPIIGSVAPTSASGIIALLEEIIPTVVKEATDLIAPIQNIIAALTGSGAVTAAQVAQLQAQSAALDAALDAAAADDSLTGGASA